MVQNTSTKSIKVILKSHNQTPFSSMVYDYMKICNSTNLVRDNRGLGPLVCKKTKANYIQLFFNLNVCSKLKVRKTQEMKVRIVFLKSF
jgi:hypothetical protein